MDVLVVGSGAREHALVVALRADPSVDALWCAPGNPGIAAQAQLHPLRLADVLARPATLAELATSLHVDLVVIGPEGPLVAGAADAVRAAGIPCFGPSAAAARLEGSKAFAKQVMAAAGVPTAMSAVAETPAEVAAALDSFGPPYVVKDDGLAAGKGVLVTDDRAAALAHAAGRARVVVEQYLDGPEVSLFALTDGRSVVPLVPAQDYKRVGDADTGPNTGGMGAYSPLPWAPPGLVDDVTARVLEPTVSYLRHAGTPFIGLLYAGLALTSRGVRVVEFNARFGDPETQVVLPRLRTPLAGLLHATATGQLAHAPDLRWSPEAAVTVVLASAGYPGNPQLGQVISGVDRVQPPAMVYHAGTALDSAGRLVSAGGRVLSVTATGPDLPTARDRAYDALHQIEMPGGFYRHDIAEMSRMPTLVPSPGPVARRAAEVP